MTTVLSEVSGDSAVVTFEPGSAGIPVLDLPQLEELNQHLDRIESQQGIDRIIFTSAGARFFLVGAPPARFQELESPDRAAHYSTVGQRTLDRIARSKKTTVSAIGGTCLAGGLELALACDLRVASDSPDLRLGFSSGLIGLLPGWGGTLRLPRRVGPSLAIELISRSTAVNSRRALDWGLIDAVVPEAKLLATAREQLPKPTRLRLLDRLAEALPALRRMSFRRAEKAAQAQAPDEDHNPAPRRLVRLVELALSWSDEDQLLQEQRAFVEAAGSPAARQMREAILS